MPLTLGSLAQLLKTETQVQHQIAEQLLYPKLEKIRTVEDYSMILKMFYGYYAPLESFIARYISKNELYDIEQRKN